MFGLRPVTTAQSRTPAARIGTRGDCTWVSLTLGFVFLFHVADQYRPAGGGWGPFTSCARKPWWAVRRSPGLPALASVSADHCSDFAGTVPGHVELKFQEQ